MYINENMFNVKFILTCPSSQQASLSQRLTNINVNAMLIEHGFNDDFLQNTNVF